MRVGTPGFVAARLTEAREARGLAQTALSELTGIKSQSISHYEQGRQSPSPEALTLLCEKLEVPQRYFLKPMPPPCVSGIFFRSYRATARTSRIKTERRLNWLKEIAAYLRSHVDLPTPALPEIPVSPNAPDTGAMEIENAADACRQHFGLGGGPLTGIVGLLENFGCVVSHSVAEDESESACSQSDAGMPYIMLAGGYAGRMRFDAAHELGHLVMHRALQTGGQTGPADPETHRILEQQADRFARAFLLPSRVFGPEVWAPTVDALLSLGKQWNCSVAVMIARCGEIGVFDGDQVRRALVNLTRRGLKSDEPRDNGAAVESPQLLARGIRLLIEAGVRDRHGLLTDLGLSPVDIEALAGLPRNFLSECGVQPPPALKLRSDYLTPGPPA
jgi:Zn-dependent peptidase ImmA (M78 family)/transcriptional regulator with XRE-family HTH domain